jgi:hypothetical protein
MLYLGVVFGGSRNLGLPLHVVLIDQGLCSDAAVGLPALLGARFLLLYPIGNFTAESRGRIWQRSDGGAALYGGLLVSFFASLPLLGLLGIPWQSSGMRRLLLLMVRMIFTRVGCLLNGCCAGRLTEGWLLCICLMFTGSGVDVCRHNSWRLASRPCSCSVRSKFGTGSRSTVPSSSPPAAYGAGRLWLESTSREDSQDRTGEHPSGDLGHRGRAFHNKFPFQPVSESLDGRFGPGGVREDFE